MHLSMSVSRSDEGGGGGKEKLRTCAGLVKLPIPWQTRWLICCKSCQRIY